MAQIVTIKPVVIPAQRRSDGSWNVKIRVTFKRRYKIISTNLTAYQRDLTKSGEIKGEVLVKANTLVRKMYEAVAELNWFDFDRMEVEDIVLWIRRYFKGKERFELDFFEYAEKFLATKKEGTALAYRTALNSFRDYIGKDKYDINEFSVTTLKAFVNAVDTSGKRNSHDREGVQNNRREKKKGLAAKTYLARLGAIYAEACLEYNDEDAGVLNIPRNPFKRIKVEAEPSVAKISKSPEFIQKIIDTRPAATRNQKTALDIYLISFALMGANTADLLTMEPAKDGVIIYNRVKTRDRRPDKAEMRVRIEPEVKALLDRYADPSGKLQFNFAGRWRNATALNSFLSYQFQSWAEANGEESFTIYSARHSWATIGRSSQCGLSKSLIDECLAHSTHKLVDVYAEKDWSILWEANRKVLDIFDWKTTNKGDSVKEIV